MKVQSGGNIVLSTYSVPFYSFDGTNETMTGVIAVDISIDWLSKIVSSIKLYDGSYSVLVSENGTIISAPNPKWPYNESLFSLADENKIPVLRKIGRDLQKGKSGFVEMRVNLVLIETGGFIICLSRQINGVFCLVVPGRNRV